MLEFEEREGGEFIEEVNDEMNMKTSGDIEARRLNKIEGFSQLRPKLVYSLLNGTRYIPKHLKGICAAYKAITVIYKLNKNRKLNLVFGYSRNSIEKMCKHRVDVEVLEKINYLASDSIKFKMIEKNNFYIEVVKTCNIDELVYNHIIREYLGWLNEMKYTQGLGSRFHPDFSLESVEIPRKKFIVCEEREEAHKVVKKVNSTELEKGSPAEKKSNDIFERIREKESRRKLEFINKEVKKFDYLKKVRDIFMVTNTKAIKMSELVCKIGEFNTRKGIVSVCNGEFSIRIIDSVEYVINNNKN